MGSVTMWTGPLQQFLHLLTTTTTITIITTMSTPGDMEKGGGGGGGASPSAPPRDKVAAAAAVAATAQDEHEEEDHPVPISMFPLRNMALADDGEPQPVARAAPVEVDTRPTMQLGCLVLSHGHLFLIELYALFMCVPSSFLLLLSFSLPSCNRVFLTHSPPPSTEFRLLLRLWFPFGLRPYGLLPRAPLSSL